MRKYQVLCAAAGLELAIAIWHFTDDVGAFQLGALSAFAFASRVVPWTVLAIIFFFQARRIRAREAGEA